VEKPSFPEIAGGGRDPARARKGRRRAYLPEERRFAEVEVYDGHRLQAGHEIAGPALVERTDTTIFISGSYAARIDRHGSCRLTAKDRA
jgi:N-methylhydantoinase A